MAHAGSKSTHTSGPAGSLTVTDTRLVTVMVTVNDGQ